MPQAVYRGPKPRLTIRATGAVLPRGATVQVTHREAALIAASPVDATVDGTFDFDQFTVAQLRRWCREHGLTAGGTKPMLIDRLMDTTVGDGPPDPDGI